MRQGSSTTQGPVLGWNRLRGRAAPSIAVALAAAFLAVAAAVATHVSQPFDDFALRALRTAADPALPIGPPWLAVAARDVTSLGSVTLIALVTLAACAGFALARQARPLALLASTAVGAAALDAALKHLFDRARPEVVPHLVVESGASFPSAHAMLSAAVSLTLAAVVSSAARRRALSLYAFALAIALTLLVGLSRVYLGVHYPTDVLAGWLAGAAWALLVASVLRPAQRA